MNTKFEVRLYVQIYLFFLILGLSSCRDSAQRVVPDVSDVEVTVKIERFDQDFSQLDKGDIVGEHRRLLTQYGAFYSDYMLHMLELGDVRDSLYVYDMLPKVMGQADFQALSEAVTTKYPSLSDYDKELTQAFQYVKYYFPSYTVPRFISFFSGFAVQTPIGADYIGIGLDMFLGANSPFYPSLVKSIPRYISRRFTPEHISPRVVEAVIRQELFPPSSADNNTLEHMIYEGKVLYALDALLPNYADTLKIGYSGDQLAWAQRHQPEIWAWFIQENLLYSTDYLRIKKYFSEAPFTPELGENNSSAPKLGSFIGWMIVRDYMAQHPELSLSALLALEDAQALLKASKFRGQ